MPDPVRAPVRLLTAAGVCLAMAAAGCSAGSPGATSAGQTAAARTSPAISPTRELALAASQARKVTSFTATLDITSSGAYSSHMTGTVEEQTRPSVRAHQKFSLTEAGAPIPGGLETLVTARAVYLKMSALSQMLGKPWLGIPFSALKQSAGVNFAPLIRQFQANNPLTLSQMLPAARNVHEVGAATVGGVRTTEYSGSYQVAQALAKLDPSLRKLLQPELSATGITTARFKVWIDGQHQIRKLTETETGDNAHITTAVVITSINRPVHIAVPPAGQVASVPGL